MLPDDILVIGDSFEQHQENLRKVLVRLRAANLRLKAVKCRLARDQVTYLGYTVSGEGISTDPGKVIAVQQFPCPTDVKQLSTIICGLNFLLQKVRAKLC